MGRKVKFPVVQVPTQVSQCMVELIQWDKAAPVSGAELIPWDKAAPVSGAELIPRGKAAPV
jgi:hypothetical protein